MEAKPPNRKTVLTTGEVARICKVAPRTVSKWFDSGQLRGYRIPGSKDRRIPVEHLVRFMRAHGIPLDGLESGTRRVLILDGDRDLRQALHDALSARGGFEVAVAGSAFEAGLVARQFKPHAFVIDVTPGQIDTKPFCRIVRADPDLQSARLIAIGRELGEARGQALLQDGFDAFLSKPFEVRALIESMELRTATAGAAR